MLEVLEEWTRGIDEGLGLDVLYLDFQKAFDSVPHRRLAAKLYRSPVKEWQVSWFLLVTITLNGTDTTVK